MKRKSDMIQRKSEKFYLPGSGIKTKEEPISRKVKDKELEIWKPEIWNDIWNQNISSKTKVTYKNVVKPIVMHTC